MSTKKSFVLYTDTREQLDLLTDAQAGMLYKALMAFAAEGTAPTFSDPMLKVMFSFISAQMRRDAEKYEAICRKRAEYGRRGGKARAEQQSKQKPANQADTVPVNDTVPDTVPVNVSDTVNDTDPVPVNVSDTVPDTVPTPSAGAEGGGTQHTQHTHTTHTQQDLSVAGILQLAKDCGFLWEPEEAEKFLAYNRKRGREDDWEFAVRCWEQNRYPRAEKAPAKQALSSREIEEMNDYLSVVNHFPQEILEESE